MYRHSNLLRARLGESLSRYLRLLLTVEATAQPIPIPGTLGSDYWYFRAIGIALLVLVVPFNEWSMRTLIDYQTLGLK